MTNVNDPLARLIDSPLIELPAAWTVPGRVRQLDECRRMATDEYWAWAAGQLRWSRAWTEVRTGELGSFRYFDDGRINICDNCVDRWAEDPATAGRAAVVWEGEPGDTHTVTYAELAAEVTSLAAGLSALGIRQGDVVAIYMPNLVEAFTVIQACSRIGAIYTVLFSGFGPDAVAARLQASRASAIVVADASYRRGRAIELLETLRSVRDRVASLETVVVVDRTGRGIEPQQGEHPYREVVELGRHGIDTTPMDPNDPAFLIFTSGTESRPKGVVHSVGGFLVGAWANAHWQVGYEEGDVYWVAADVGWLTFPIQGPVGGLANGMTIACFEGALDTPTTARFYEICEKHRVTKVLAAPTVARMLRSFGDELARRHPLNLKLFTMQGEPLDPETFSWTTATFDAPVVNAYGQTETGSTWTYPVYGVDALKAGSVGRAVPGHEFAILDESGKPVRPGVKGTLVLTAPLPTLARTVWDDPDRYRSTYFARYPGVYCTNDEAVVDDDGHLWVLGRIDDVINIAAHRISTTEIESVISEVPSVAEVAVIGVPDETKGTVPVACVTLRDGADRDAVADDIQHAVAAEIGRYARLSAVYVVRQMPKTRTGKTMRRLVRDYVTVGHAVGDTSAMEDPAALDALADAIAGNAGTDARP